MSERSYLYRIEEGVTGPYHETCEPSAWDQIAPDGCELQRSDYLNFMNYVDRFNRLGGDGRYTMMPEWMSLFKTMARHLGAVATEEPFFYRPKSYLGFARKINHLVRGDWRVILYLRLPGYELNHTVGLIPSSCNGVFQLRSNWVPDEFAGGASPKILYEFLAPPSTDVLSDGIHTVDYPFSDHNVTALKLAPPK